MHSKGKSCKGDNNKVKVYELNIYYREFMNNRE